MEIECECECPKCGHVFDQTVEVEPDDSMMDLD